MKWTLDRWLVLDQYACGIRDEDSKLVAQVKMKEHEDLIAAAPDLLEACELAHNKLEWSVLREAIAKAKGETS